MGSTRPAFLKNRLRELQMSGNINAIPEIKSIQEELQAIPVEPSVDSSANPKLDIPTATQRAPSTGAMSPKMTINSPSSDLGPGEVLDKAGSILSKTYRNATEGGQGLLEALTNADEDQPMKPTNRFNRLK